MKIKLQTLLKHKLQWLLLLAALLGVNQGVWGANRNFLQNECIYFKNFTPSGWSDPWITSSGKGYVYLCNGNSNTRWIQLTLHSGTAGTNGAIYKAIVPAAENHKTYVFTRGSSSYTGGWSGSTGFWNQSGDITIDTSGKNLVETNSSQSYYAVAPSSCTISLGGSHSGSGTSADPYIVSSGESLTFTITATQADPGMTGVGANVNTTGSKASSASGTSVTVSKTASSTAGTSETWTGYAWAYKNSTSTYSSSYATSSSNIYTRVAPACTAPTVTTNTTATSIGLQGATVKGTVTDGTCAVTETGIVYGTSANPTGNAQVISHTSGTQFSKTLSGLTPGTKYYFRAYAKTASGTTYGSDGSFTTTACSAPTISTQPYNTATRRYCINTETPATLTVAATGGVGSYTYQWQQRNDGSDAFTNVTTGTGYQTASFTPSNATSGNRYYRCIVTNKDVCTSNSVTSNESCKYTINRLSASGTLSGDGTYCQGASGDTQTLTLTDYVGSRQWHKSTTSDFTPTNDTKISGATGTTYNAPINTTGTMYYKVVVTNGACPSETTDQATVTVAPNPEVYTVSGTATICSGESTNVTISNTETGFSYRLYKDGAATKEMFIGNGSSRSFSVTAAATYTIYAYNSSAPSCANNMSGSAIVSVDATSVGGSISGGSTSVCPGTTKNLTLGSYTGSIQWHSSSESGFTPSSTTAISGATSATYAAPISTAGTKYYKAVVKNGVCAAATSSQSYLTVKRSAVAGDYTLTNNAQTYNGSARAVTVTPDEGAGTPTVYYTGTGGTSYVKSTSAPINAGSYTITVDAANGDSYCAATDLNVGTLTISKANQNTLTISNTLLDFVYCDGANTTLTTTGGSGDGAVTYSVTSGSGDIEGSTLTATAEGSISVTATKAASTNYNATTSAAKTFNFNVDAPTVYTLSNVGGATTICGDPSSGAGSGTLRLANSQTGYNYQLYSNGSPVEGYAAKAGTTGSSIDFPVTSSGTYTVYAYYGTNSSNCATQMDGEITLTISTQPKLVRSAATVTQYMPVTVTCISTDIYTWEVTNEGSTAYLYDQTYNSIDFKGASTDASTAKTYTITATTKGGCSESTTITVNPDSESCD